MPSVLGRPSGPFSQPLWCLASPPAALVLAREQRFQRGEAWGTIFGGWALAEQGQGVEGIAQIRQGLTAWQTAGQEPGRPP
jgi:hypothetical protein